MGKNDHDAQAETREVQLHDAEAKAIGEIKPVNWREEKNKRNHAKVVSQREEVLERILED